MRLVRLFSAVLLLAASAVFASDKLPVESNTYGTSALTWATLSAWDFHPRESAATYAINGAPSFGIYATAGRFFEATLKVPAGAVVSVIELAACDTNATFDMTVNITGQLKTGVSDGGIGGGPNTSFATGCQVASAAITPITVNNDAEFYLIEVDFHTVTDTSLVLNSVRVGYKLQISPDPGTATFADVPVGHPFHRFVEALAAAGITGGCGNGNYCPDAPITRGQMAVFLSAALGLHWAP